jgi:glycosyltransferase involved in cell wall biosynthesis
LKLHAFHRPLDFLVPSLYFLSIPTGQIKHYHFEKPMLVTNVGGLADLVPHLKVGVVTEPNVHAIASGILQLYELGEIHFFKQLCEEKKKLSWDKLTAAIIENK